MLIRSSRYFENKQKNPPTVHYPPLIPKFAFQFHFKYMKFAFWMKNMK